MISLIKNVIRYILSLNVRGLKLSIGAKINQMAVNSSLAVVVKILLQMPLASWQMSRWWCKYDRCSILLRCITDSFCSTFNEKRKFESCASYAGFFFLLLKILGNQIIYLFVVWKLDWRKRLKDFHIMIKYQMAGILSYNVLLW